MGEKEQESSFPCNKEKLFYAHLINTQQDEEGSKVFLYIKHAKKLDDDDA